MPLTVPSPQMLLVIDTATASTGAITSPSPQMGTWLLAIAQGKTALQTAAAFASDQKYPVGTLALVIDLSVAPLVIQEFQLTAQWVAA